MKYCSIFIEQYCSAMLPLTVYLPTTTTGMYLSNTINFT